jgi:hypothetical protein
MGCFTGHGLESRHRWNAEGHSKPCARSKHQEWFGIIGLTSMDHRLLAGSEMGQPIDQNSEVIHKLHRGDAGSRCKCTAVELPGQVGELRRSTSHGASHGEAGGGWASGLSSGLGMVSQKRLHHRSQIVPLG